MLQYADVFRHLHNRNHFIFDHTRDVFESSSFIDYQTKMLIHLEISSTSDNNTACINSVLPGTVSRLFSIDRGVDTLSQTFKDYKQSIICQTESVLHT